MFERNIRIFALLFDVSKLSCDFNQKVNFTYNALHKQQKVVKKLSKKEDNKLFKNAHPNNSNNNRTFREDQVPGIPSTFVDEGLFKAGMHNMRPMWIADTLS